VHFTGKHACLRALSVAADQGLTGTRRVRKPVPASQTARGSAALVRRTQNCATGVEERFAAILGALDKAAIR